MRSKVWNTLVYLFSTMAVTHKEQFVFPKKYIRTAFVAEGTTIYVDYPTDGTVEKPSQFAIYLYSCLQGREYQRLGVKTENNQEPIMLRTYMRSREIDGNTFGNVQNKDGKIIISRSEQVKLKALLEFCEDDPTLTGLCERIAQQRNLATDKIWIDVAGFSNWLPNPLFNVYKVKNRIFKTALTRYSELCVAMDTILEPDPRMKGMQETFMFDSLDIMCKDVPFLFRGAFYREMVKPNRHNTTKGLTYPFIHHAEHSMEFPHFK
jgi:hypothetical protein